jgi:hypothetical protein
MSYIFPYDLINGLASHECSVNKIFHWYSHTSSSVWGIQSMTLVRLFRSRIVFAFRRPVSWNITAVSLLNNVIHENDGKCLIQFQFQFQFQLTPLYWPLCDSSIGHWTIELSWSSFVMHPMAVSSQKFEGQVKWRVPSVRFWKIPWNLLRNQILFFRNPKHFKTQWWDRQTLVLTWRWTAIDCLPIITKTKQTSILFLSGIFRDVRAGKSVLAGYIEKAHA